MRGLFKHIVFHVLVDTHKWMDHSHTLGFEVSFALRGFPRLP
jgi:hypothetical protein